MSAEAVAKLTVDCPVCGGPIDIDVAAELSPVYEVGGAAVVQLSSTVAEHECLPGPPDGDGERVAA